MDTSKLRDGDQLYVADVTAYLTERGLTVELAGSALRGDQQYKDIDLSVRGSPEAVTDAICGLLRLSGSTEPFPERSPDSLEYRIEHVGGPMRYISTIVDNRFKIRVGETNIDLNFVRS